MSTSQRRRSELPFWRFVRFLSKNWLFLVSFVLLAISTFYYVQAEAYRDSLGQTEAAASENSD